VVVRRFKAAADSVVARRFKAVADSVVVARPRADTRPSTDTPTNQR